VHEILLFNDLVLCMQVTLIILNAMDHKVRFYITHAEFAQNLKANSEYLYNIF